MSRATDSDLRSHALRNSYVMVGGAMLPIPAPLRPRLEEKVSQLERRHPFRVGVNKSAFGSGGAPREDGPGQVPGISPPTILHTSASAESQFSRPAASQFRSLRHAQSIDTVSSWHSTDYRLYNASPLSEARLPSYTRRARQPSPCTSLIPEEAVASPVPHFAPPSRRSPPSKPTTKTSPRNPIKKLTIVETSLAKFGRSISLTNNKEHAASSSSTAATHKTRRDTPANQSRRAASQSPSRVHPAPGPVQAKTLALPTVKKPRRLSLVQLEIADPSSPPPPLASPALPTTATEASKSPPPKARRFSRPDVFIKAKINDLIDQRRESKGMVGHFQLAPLGSYIEPAQLRIFVGTWNTECVPVTWRSFLVRGSKSRPTQNKQNIGDVMATGTIKTVAGNPIKSTVKSQVFSTLSYHESDMSYDDLQPETLCWTSSGDEASSLSSASDDLVAPSSVDEAVSARPARVPGASHLRRTSSAFNLRSGSQKLDQPQRKRHRVLFRPGTTDTVQASEIDPHGPLREWIQKGYDIYLICVQECSAMVLFDIIATYCSKINGVAYKSMELDAFKISGYGDGATFFPKSTAIGCICRVDYIDRAWTVLDSYAYSFHKLNASKGAVCLVAEAMQQRILFIGCHLTPANAQARLQSRIEVRRRICEWLNIKSFDDHFDHVIWSGDFNFRLREMNSRKAIQCLEQHALRTLFDFDEINDSIWSQDLAADKFMEPEISFFPTYKKVKGRDPTDRMRAGWVSEEYAIKYKAQWYKGGRTKDRVPAWTDRIIKWSSNIATKPLFFVQGSYTAADNLDADNPIIESDHSPVGVGLVLGAA
eukprot:Gregarina_sp_Pseudo_9__4508@NODE_467_length_2775_cov_4_435673_g443_i0_p1_GENE_NODE_467_length_2775_cov_4_435673_g443_i0NODE_467_length_2775_cov_4_435673_g443_i0_p1_ORF_typecomplete_len823_score70_59Exo_endo_phos/PF03372_23/0_014_NODE_467_length_2775_cov_4_435673_g443_i0572525